ncbi:nucleotidyltransferase family protein [Paenibacillus sp. OK060]|uniref:nucleotidyltransferase family protein n=1 Tax=Paenibacillus sp. OK060 TaxID=1881034 RepID=UPI0015A31552|nr:nucleotidyltransferase family protein [Paenibacillus sp. OK060]
MDWSRVLGLLQYHRVTGMVWSNIQKYLKKLDVQLSYEKLFSNVSQSYNLQLNKAKEQWEHTKRVCQKFDENGINYALLKGIALSACVYKDWGARNFGDTDILIHPSQINLATQCLKDVGYIQGVINLDRSDIVAASRKDTMFWSLVSHEVHPFIIKTPNSLIIHSHEVDLQFSIDLNTANRTDVSVTNLLDNSISVNIDNTRIKTLNWEDFLIFLCIHYYKEATTIRDVKAYNDLTLYKLCDIFYLLVHKEICIDWNKFHESVEATQSHKGVYYALSNLNSLYIDVVSDDILIRLKPQDLSYLDEVYHYNSNEIAGRWDMSFAERFFDPNRIIKLNEEIAMSNRS